ncbi:MurR/RpiR family transcriptional regulator [Pantoea agglomerans]|nr:MurR/RpiR family transcriptional regulator [Pantoea agglomerans]MBD8157122.1 MurR/RpiR family transcriptional regulator [Pantoea agglomerans]MBD8234112.1 MurR/RpiR family transcriptional regulator [Pantoea agglomerans]
MNMLEKIEAQFAALSNAEQKVARQILAAPQAAMHSSIATLAREACVSEPTVNRFCHRLGARGFPDFKLQLAQSLVKSSNWVSRGVEDDDSVENYSHKIFDSALAGLQRVRDQLDSAQLQQAVTLITQADKLAFFGLGASAVVAHDAFTKFLRFNLPVIWSDDIVIQRMSCINSRAGDVFVLISHTGRTKNMVELARLARVNGSTVIAITSADSPLAHEAAIALVLDVPEDTDIYLPMVSRLAQLTVIDVLATGFTLERGAPFRENLKRVKKALKASRYEKHTIREKDDQQKN